MSVSLFSDHYISDLIFICGEEEPLNMDSEGDDEIIYHMLVSKTSRGNKT